MIEYWLVPIVFATSCMTAVIGMGGGVLLITLMPGLVPAGAIIPIHAFTQLGSNLSRAAFGWRHIDKAILPAFVVGAGLGAWLGSEVYDSIDLHLIGPLQTNKARQAMDLCQAIHSVDRPKLANTLARLAQETGACPDLFVQVNTGEEDQKAGVMPADTDAFVQTCRDLDLPVRGLMCIPPVDEEPSLHFALLAKLAGRNGLDQLSMGMSADFETAIALGATHVRVGSAIFGERVKQA